MPTPEQFQTSLSEIANTWQLFAVLWHLYFSVLAVGLIKYHFILRQPLSDEFDRGPVVGGDYAVGRPVLCGGLGLSGLGGTQVLNRLIDNLQ